jgi:hypothetical protein
VLVKFLRPPPWSGRSPSVAVLRLRWSVFGQASEATFTGICNVHSTKLRDYRPDSRICRFWVHIFPFVRHHYHRERVAATGFSGEKRPVGAIRQVGLQHCGSTFGGADGILG